MAVVDKQVKNNFGASKPLDKVTDIEDKKKGITVATDPKRDTDQDTYEKWAEKVARVNPVVLKDGKNDAITERLENHFSNNVNVHKECFFWCGPATREDGMYASSYNADRDWRKKSNNGFGEVSPKVTLYMSDPKMSLKFSNDIGLANPLAAAMSSGIGQKISKATEFARAASGVGGGRFMQRFTGAPIFKDTSTLDFEGSLKFDFKFGQFGLFDGFEEVVKPVMALASIFAVGTPGGAGNSMQVSTPYPTSSQFAATWLKSALSSIGGNFTAEKLLSGLDDKDGDGKKDVSSVKDVIKVATNVENAVRDTLDAGIISILNNGGYGNEKTGAYRIVHFRYGHFYVGPCYCKDVKIDFETKHFDENGWPIAGSITIGGLTTIEKATKMNLRSRIQ